MYNQHTHLANHPWACSAVTLTMTLTQQASNGLVLSLEKGDEVQVRIQTNSAGQLMGDVYTIFSGFFISP